MFVVRCLRALSCFLWSASLGVMSAQAATPLDKPRLVYAQAMTDQEQLRLDLAFHVPNLPPFYSEALLHGIPLYIRIDLQLQKVDWRFFKHNVLEKSVEWKVSYHQLTEKYRLTQGTLYRVFSGLPAVLDVVSHLWSWSVYDHVDTRTHYLVSVRWSIDNARLPLIFQVGHFATDQWSFDSGWSLLPIVSGQGHFGVLPDAYRKPASSVTESLREEKMKLVSGGLGMRLEDAALKEPGLDHAAPPMVSAVPWSFPESEEPPPIFSQSMPIFRGFPRQQCLLWPGPLEYFISLLNRAPQLPTTHLFFKDFLLSLLSTYAASDPLFFLQGLFV